MADTDLGKKLYIATGLPATFDQAGYEAQTWVQVKGVEDMGEIGVTHATISVNDLEAGRTYNKKGAATGTSTNVTLRNLPGDAGQAALKAACADVSATNDEYSYYAEDQAGAIEYWSGSAHSWNHRRSGLNTSAGFTCTIENDTDVVYVAA